MKLALEASLASAGSVYIDAAAVQIIPQARLLPPSQCGRCSVAVKYSLNPVQAGVLAVVLGSLQWAFPRNSTHLPTIFRIILRRGGFRMLFHHT